MTAEKGVKAFAVGPHTGSPEHQGTGGTIWTYPKFKENIDRAMPSGLAISIVKPSVEATKEFKLPIELLFIDGAHEHEPVSQDSDSWFPRVVNGGAISFHDSVGPQGPPKVIRRRLCKGGNFTGVSLVDSIVFATRVGRVGLRGKIRNRLFGVRLSGLYSTRAANLPTVLRRAEQKVIRLG